MPITLCQRQIEKLMEDGWKNTVCCIFSGHYYRERHTLLFVWYNDIESFTGVQMKSFQNLACRIYDLTLRGYKNRYLILPLLHNELRYGFLQN